ncbi:MAG: SDR family NAD(P)-dependent oxidoreductase [Gammaproteobacteria bacterium]
MKDLDGKVAFITGGSSGVGLGIVRAMVDAGMKVAFTWRREAHRDEAMGFFEGREDRIHPIYLDVTDREGMDRAADEAESRFGPVDILVNNAGVNAFFPMDEATYDDWDWIIDVNLKGIINGLITFMPRLKARGAGHIVNTSSMAAFLPGPAAGIYSTTKYAIHGLSACLRYCLAPYNIGVSMLCPGLVVSNIHQSEDIRPEAQSRRGYQPDEELIKEIGDVHALGMEPLEVGEKTLRGIRNNDLYIFTHPEHKQELREIFENILAAIPDEEPDPKRLEVEADRRAGIAEAQKVIDKMREK